MKAERVRPDVARVRDPQDVTALARLASPACGSVKPISGRGPLRCERPVGHDGDHGVLDVVGDLLVRWSR